MNPKITDHQAQSRAALKSPLLKLLGEIRDSFNDQSLNNALVLKVEVAPWNSVSDGGHHAGLENWLKNHFIPATTDCPSFEEIFEPFEWWQHEQQDVFFKIVRTKVDPAGNLDAFWRDILLQFPVPNEDKFPLPLFDIIDITSLLTYPNWRLALDRSLKLLRPGGWVVFPEFYKDALLLDGRVADWVKWNNRENNRRSNRWCRLMYRLLRYTEREFNRPWIPELGLCESRPTSSDRLAPRPLYDILLELCDEDSQPKLVQLDRCSFTFHLDNPLDLLGIPCLSAYISESELRKLRARIEAEVRHTEDNHREIQIGCQWNALQLFGAEKAEGRNPCARIDAVISYSLTSEHRNFLDNSHFLLPEFSAKKTTSSIEEKILRSLRGFVCRMIHHDRLDQDNHHLFVASLWLPEVREKTTGLDFAKGRFAHVTGCVFRRDSENKLEILDEALSQISYWAHAQANGITLQSIPQLLFDSDRPVIRVLTGEKWEHELRGYGQLDLSERHRFTPDGDNTEHLEDVEDAVFIPSEITIRIPDLDKSGQKWKAFKSRYVTPLLDEIEPGFTESLGKRLSDEIWTIREGKVFSFPWNMKFEEAVGEKSIRGRPAGFLTKKIAEKFTEDHNILIEILTADTSGEWRGFTDMMNRLLDEIGISGARKHEAEKEYRTIFNALVALTLVFPGSSQHAPQEGLWELLQAPIGAFIDSEQGKFISAGSCLLIKKVLTNNSGNRQMNPDDRLRRRLCQTRSTQIMRRVPTVLLPLSTLLLANLLIDEETKGRVKGERAEAAQGLLHNLRNLIAPALASRKRVQEVFELWFGTPEDSTDWFEQYVLDEELSDDVANTIRDWIRDFKKHAQQVSEGFNERVSAEMVQRTIDAYYWYLSDKNYPDDKRDDINKILANAIAAVWETWGMTLIWVPVDNRHLRRTSLPENLIPSDDEWDQRMTDLLELRKAASGSALTELQTKLEGTWWFIPDRLGIEWKLGETINLISYPSIAFHILYELAWNGIKYLASEAVLYDLAATRLIIKLEIGDTGGPMSITYSQPCFGETLLTIVEALKDKREGRTKLPEMTGIQGLRSMVKKCGWEMSSRAHGDLLVVDIVFTGQSVA